MQRIYFTRLLAAGTLLAGTAACGGSQQAAGGALPGGATPSIAHPMAAATPPVTAPVTIPYPYTNTWKTTTWSGPSAKPKTKPGSESGKIVVKFTVDKKTGVYFVPETIDSNAGYTEVLNSAITFPPYKKGTAQIILSDNFSYVQGPYTETGLDTYPQTPELVRLSADERTQVERRSGARVVRQSDADRLSNRSKRSILRTSPPTGSTPGKPRSRVRRVRRIRITTPRRPSVSQSNPSSFTLSEPAAGFNTLDANLRPAVGHLHRRRVVRKEAGAVQDGESARSELVSERLAAGGAVFGRLQGDGHRDDALRLRQQVERPIVDGRDRELLGPRSRARHARHERDDVLSDDARNRTVLVRVHRRELYERHVRERLGDGLRAIGAASARSKSAPRS